MWKKTMEIAPANAQEPGKDQVVKSTLAMLSNTIVFLGRGVHIKVFILARWFRWFWPTTHVRVQPHVSRRALSLFLAPTGALIRRDDFDFFQQHVSICAIPVLALTGALIYNTFYSLRMVGTNLVLNCIVYIPSLGQSPCQLLWQYSGWPGACYYWTLRLSLV